MSMRVLLLAIVAVFAAVVTGRTANAELELPSLFGDHMVLQANAYSPVWGWADPGATVTVRIGDYEESTVARDNGAWILRLPRMAPGTSIEMTISAGDDALTLRDIVVGEVWVGSGQSNMQWSVERSANAEDEIANADYPELRLFSVRRDTAASPQSDCEGEWVVCSPETVPGFSAVAYFFGRELYRELELPVGLINTSWGGTAAEAWTSPEMMDALPEYTALADSERAQEQPQHRPSSLFNAMVQPLIPFQIRGVIWYQGESNSGRAYAYRKLFPAMIDSWRTAWGQGDFPFYFVQIAPYEGYRDTTGTELREAQFLALDVENTGMVVTTDIATLDDIHPPNKQDVGKRLARWALAHEYGQDDVIPSGPLYASMEIKGDRVELTFDHVGRGLEARGGELTHFAIAGADQQFVEAEAKIKGKKVIVWSDAVDDPVAVRFGWEDTAVPNLFNKAGLPASTFRTDDWPGVTHPDNGGQF